MEWISVKDRLPEISYFESDNESVPYESHPVLVFSSEKPGIMCVAYLCQEQDEKKWSFGDFSWESYIPGDGGNIAEIDFEVFSYWMPLPSPP